MTSPDNSSKRVCQGYPEYQKCNICKYYKVNNDLTTPHYVFYGNVGNDGGVVVVCTSFEESR